jgi:hypothetical protein
MLYFLKISFFCIYAKISKTHLNVLELHVNLLIFLNNKRKFILKTKSKMMNTPDIFYNFFDHKDSAWSFQITNLGNIECVNFNSEMYLLLINLS